MPAVNLVDNDSELTGVSYTDEVFSEDSRKSYSHAPITMGHPDKNVTADNWGELAVGEVDFGAG